MFARRNRCAVPLAGGRSQRRYAVSALATAGSRGNSIFTLVFGLWARRTPAFQSTSCKRRPSTSAAPKPYVANRTSIAKSRFPGGSDCLIDRRIRFTCGHGNVLGGLASLRTRGATTLSAKSVSTRPVVRRNLRKDRSELQLSATVDLDMLVASSPTNASRSTIRAVCIVLRLSRRC